MPDRELIITKLAELRSYYEELVPLLTEESRIIIDHHLKLHTIERLFQLIVDTAVDVNTHIISSSGIQIPEDYQNTFITLGEHKILSMHFAGTIAHSVGLRNLVVHKYGKVDLKRMIDEIKENIGQYLEFMKYIDSFCTRLPAA